MISKLLTTFNRNNHADLGEKIGNISLGLLRIGCGKTVIVEKIPDTDKTVFTKKVHSTSTKVAAVALFILRLPVALLLTSIGCIGTAFSKSHDRIFNSYIQSETLKRKSQKNIQFGSTKGGSLNLTCPTTKIENQQSIEVKQENKSFEKNNNIVPQERKIPPIGMCDTIIFSPLGPQSLHGSGELFSDSEIVEKLDVLKRVEIASNSSIYASYTQNGKAIIQQQATRGCTAATAAMLIMDNGKTPDRLALTTRNLGDDENQLKDIQNAGLKGVINSAKNLSELRKLIIKNNSCVVGISGKIGNHVVVVDDVSADLSKIRLRDPYHGWEITVSSEAFLKEWSGGKAIQIIKKN